MTQYRKLKGKDVKTLKAEVEMQTYQLVEQIATEQDMSLGAALDWIAKKLQAKSTPTI